MLQRQLKMKEVFEAGGDIALVGDIIMIIIIKIKIINEGINK